MPNNKKCRKKGKKIIHCASKSGVLVAAAPSTSEKKSPPSCYHGCTEEEFHLGGEYRKVVDYFVKKTAGYLLKINEGDKNCEAFEKWDAKFDQQYGHLFPEPAFSRYVFARSTEEYLNPGGNRFVVKSLLIMGLKLRYYYLPKSNGENVDFGSSLYQQWARYDRDICTERGTINCLARETPCRCMSAKKVEAKSMKKVDYCHVCTLQYPKETMMLCSGCRDIAYCSRECQLKDWPFHKDYCKEFQKECKRTKIIEASMKEKIVNGNVNRKLA